MPLFRSQARARLRALEEAGTARQAGDGAAAVDALAPLLLAHADDPAANIEMARALQLLDDAAGAEEHYRRALHVTLAYPIVVELAGVVAAQGRAEEAEETLDAALVMTQRDQALDPGEVHLMRAMLAVGGRDMQAAEAALATLAEVRRDERFDAQTKRLRDRLAALI